MQCFSKQHRIKNSANCLLCIVATTMNAAIAIVHVVLQESSHHEALLMRVRTSLRVKDGRKFHQNSESFRQTRIIWAITWNCEFAAYRRFCLNKLSPAKTCRLQSGFKSFGECWLLERPIFLIPFSTLTLAHTTHARIHSQSYILFMHTPMQTHSLTYTDVAIHSTHPLRHTHSCSLSNVLINNFFSSDFRFFHLQLKSHS